MNRLENLKMDNFRYFSNYKWLSNWEEFLTSDYWKSWQTKIPVFQTEKELNFYTQRLGEIADLIHRCKKYGVEESANADLLIKKEEIRLQNISHEDWKKEYKFSDVELKEMSVGEIKKNFGKDIDLLFEKDSDDNIGYDNWTKEQLITEINRLKAENEQLKNNQTLTTSERQERLQQNQQKLEKLLSYDVSNQPQKNNDKGIGAGIILAIIGVVSVLTISSAVVVKSKFNKKKR